MEHRRLGHSGLKVPVLSLGTGTFGGVGEFFGRWGATDVADARRLLDICFEHGLNFFDTADIYSAGASEEILGEALKGRRNEALIATKATFTTGKGPNDKGSSRHHLVRACEASLRRLQTEHIDLYFMHGFDALTPVEETLRALDDLTRAGKIRYIGCSNFSGWQVMKALATSERYGLNRYVCYQGYYSLIGRDYEWELMPLSLDQGLGTMVWSPLGWGRLTGKTVPQVALNWLLQRPGVANLVIGARNEEQLRQNLAAVGWSLSPEQVAKLDAASQRTPIYPYWHQRGFDERNPKPTKW